MPTRAERCDADSVRDSWDHAAAAYTERQLSGRDHYRYDFFGPAQIAMCGNVARLRLLDVGCGSGYFAREMAQRGALVTGIDISSRMIEQANHLERASPLGIQYLVGDAADVAAYFAPESVDVATSCAALQDMPHPATVLRGVYAVLRPGARFVASITHPFSDTPYREWERDAAGRKRWLCVDRYFDRGPIAMEWIRAQYPFTTASLHATLQDWFEWILAAGFQLRALSEPQPSEQTLATRPDLEDAARVPYFLLLDLVRPE